MSEEREILLGTAERVFVELTPAERLTESEFGGWHSDGWRMIEDAGLALALVPEEKGGFGVSPTDALAVVRLAGAAALPFPLAETMICNRLLALVGLTPLDGVVSLDQGAAGQTLSLRRDGRRWQVSGRLLRVPWGRWADHVLAAADDRIVCLPRDVMKVTADNNLAGEPRDDVLVDGYLSTDQVTDAPSAGQMLRLAGAAMRSIAIAGAIQRMLAMTTAYAGERVQFGKPIGRFQTIQQYLAVLAGQSAAAAAAADLAADAVAAGLPALPIAVAKTRAGEAAGLVAALAHQVHGAIGFTYEHPLQRLTRRAWSWRDEFGGEAEWSSLIGHEVCAAGADGLWALAVRI